MRNTNRTANIPKMSKGVSLIKRKTLKAAIPMGDLGREHEHRCRDNTGMRKAHARLISKGLPCMKPACKAWGRGLFLKISSFQ